MRYFITGASGFIGKFLVERLLERSDAELYVLLRESSRAKFEALAQRYGEARSRIHLVYGDVTRSGLVDPRDLERLRGRIDHLFHLAAVYDMNMDDETAERVNNEGTRNVVRFAQELGGKVVLHHVSSIAVAGAHHRGVFREDMFEVGQRLDHPYYRSKYQSEQIVRRECGVPFRIYRPGIVVGHSQTGEIDKIDGPYYFFRAIQAIRGTVPKWMPMLGIEGGRIALAPVDYVASAMDILAHKPGLDGRCFFLVQSPAPTAGELMEALLTAAHGPDVAARLELPRIPAAARRLTERASRLASRALQPRLERVLGVPFAVITQMFNEIVFDDRQARAALKESGLRCPDIHEYADRLWSYWETHFKPENARVPLRLTRKLAGRVVLVTGASSGIGYVTAKKLASAGACVLLVARRREQLEELREEIESAGGEAHVFPCDLSDLQAVDAMADAVMREFEHVDVLINNAGRSIRRAVFESLDRFHDFERTMQLNYFGAVRLTMRMLPAMARRRRGHVINVSSVGVLSNAPRYAAYVASKAALDAFGRCLAAEVRSRNIAVTSIYMPLVRTPMISPTKLYEYVPTWSPETAADKILEAIVTAPKSMASPLGTTAALSYAVWPKINDVVLSTAFQLFPGTPASREGRFQSLEPETSDERSHSRGVEGLVEPFMEQSGRMEPFSDRKASKLPPESNGASASLADVTTVSSTAC